MATISSTLNIDDGLSQSERSLPALDPEFAVPDERSAEDLLREALRFAPMVRYYNFSDEPDGTWEAFFDSDIDVLVRLVSDESLKTIVVRQEHLVSRLRFSESCRESNRLLEELLSASNEMLSLSNRFRDRLELARNRRPGTESLLRISRETVTLEKRFAEVAEAVKSAFPECRPPAGGAPVRDPVSDDSHLSPQTDLTPVQPLLKQLLPLINTLNGELIGHTEALIAASGNYIRTSKPDGSIYDPHIGLFMTFLELFRHLQDTVNKVPGRHLSYYYRDVLQMEPLRATPDRAWLVLQPMPGAAPVHLPAGEQFEASVPGKPERIRFVWQQAASITDAVIDRLAVSYLSPGRLGGAEPDRNLYTAEIPVIQIADFMKSEQRSSWPLMGEDQIRLPENARTMPDADVGVLIASPLLYLEDGARIITLQIHFSRESAAAMDKYLVQGAADAGYNEFAFARRLLSHAFRISLTTEAGWMESVPASVRSSLSSTSPYLEIRLSLSPKDAPVAAYVPGIHGPDHQLGMPAIRLMLNPSSFHNPLGLFLNAGLERISLTASVTGASKFSIRNSLGPLSVTAPFQPFGPLPEPGSFLDIIAPSVFNRYTEQFRLNFEWLGLPRDPGGFDAYYAGYGNAITNASFKAGLARVSRGRPEPATGQEQAQLFETYRDDTMQSYLRETSTIEYTYRGKIVFGNDAWPSSVFDPAPEHGGVLRLTLADPADAFGHKLYPVLFPEVLTHNARRFSTNRKIPSPPYTPLLNRLSIDYTLSHTELLSSETSGYDDGALRLIQIAPFGARQAYPNDTHPKLLPDIPEGNNLYLGLSNLTAGQELNLLFLLDEANFTHTRQKLDPVVWSYLLHDRWWPLREIDILSDTTSRFTRSGIVSLQLGNDVYTGDNTIMERDIFWLRASVGSGNVAHSRALAVFTQGGEVVRAQDAGTDAGFMMHIPSAAISGSVRKLPGIAEVLQPVASFGGTVAESDEAFRVRVSERLRHKGNAVTRLDISQLILQHFPGIMMLRCFSVQDMDRKVAGGSDIHIIVIPRNAADYARRGQEPRVNLATLLSVKAFISGRLSAFATAEVGNPVYERVKIICTIRLRDKSDHAGQSQSARRLNEDIRQLITPWMYENSEAVQVGNRIYLAQLLSDLRKLPYVASVRRLSVLHFYRAPDPHTGEEKAFVTDTAVQNLRYIQASRKDAILLSVARNIITIDEGEGGDAQPSGIGSLIIGTELPVNAPQDLSELRLPAAVQSGQVADGELFNFSFNT